MELVEGSFRTVDACPDIAGFSIFALRGMMVDRNREIQLSGREAGTQQGRKNIKGGVITANWRHRDFLDDCDGPRSLAC